MPESQRPSQLDQTVPFEVKDCALIALATGRRAYNLKEFRDHLNTVHLGSIYYHFWGGLLQPRFEEREYNNDFASWAQHGLHDSVLAERLAVVDPSEFHDTEELRQETLEVVEERLDESEALFWLRATEPFEFIRSQIVVFDTHRRIVHPVDLPGVLPHLSTSSIFYHYIDGRRRGDGNMDDFSTWLSDLGGSHQQLCDRLNDVDPYFVSLAELRSQLVAVVEAFYREAAP